VPVNQVNRITAVIIPEHAGRARNTILGARKIAHGYPAAVAAVQSLNPLFFQVILKAVTSKNYVKKLSPVVHVPSIL